MPNLRPDQYVSVFFICLGLLLSHKHSVLEALPEFLAPAKPELIKVAPIPIFQFNQAATSSAAASTSAELFVIEEKKFTATLSAQAIYVLDVPSASVLLSKNPTDLRYPASTTKLMTALITRDVFDLTTFLTVDREASTSGTIIGLHRGEKIPVRNLLSGMLIQSGNDAAEVLANNHPEGRQVFIEAMNAKAKALHLDQTNFTNPSGIDTIGHQSTARDLALLAREIMKDPLLAEIVRTPTETIQGQGTSSAHVLVNTNALLGQELGVIGVKTGTTDLAGEVLITQLRREERELLIVVMGSLDRYSDTKAIINWIQSHYIWIEPNSDTLNR